jgi:hypothetical protein
VPSVHIGAGDLRRRANSPSEILVEGGKYSLSQLNCASSQPRREVWRNEEGFPMTFELRKRLTEEKGFSLT